ncbi:MAG: hypothetical protein JWN70_1056 [Planctomycetaceae bacterium]|nr:hypothetical protein [Planctomycetaceae bacterium]
MNAFESQTETVHGLKIYPTCRKRAAGRIDLCGQIHSGVAQTSQLNFGSRRGFYESGKLCPDRFILLKFPDAATDEAVFRSRSRQDFGGHPLDRPNSGEFGYTAGHLVPL